jgi:hypothetical protein
LDPQTALIWAACEGYMEAAELLIDHGADLEATDNDGRFRSTDTEPLRLISRLTTVSTGSTRPHLTDWGR